MLGDEVIASDDMVAAAEAARRAARACTPEGRPLYAAHAALPWPGEPHLVLWHAVTLLREFRGDGHVAALVSEGIDGCESLVTHGAADSLVTLDGLRLTRGWSDAAWTPPARACAPRGWLDDGDALTPEGAPRVLRLERLTDERAMAPWWALGEDDPRGSAGRSGPGAAPSSSRGPSGAGSPTEAPEPAAVARPCALRFRATATRQPTRGGHRSQPGRGRRSPLGHGPRGRAPASPYARTV